MKRAIVLLAVGAALAGFTFACSDDSSNTLKDGTPSTIAGGDDDDSTPAPAPSSTTQKTTAASTVQSTAAKADAGTDPLAQCDPAKTTTFADCAKCCATKQPAVADLNNCACGTGSKCGTDCGQSLCAGGIPDIGCGLCLIQAGCDFSNAQTDPDTSTNDADSCLQQCEAKP